MLDQYPWKSMSESVVVETKELFERGGTGGKGPIEESTGFPRDFVRF